jgi:hypothetical protein
MSKDTRIKKISRITVALLAWTAWMTIFAVPVRAVPWRGAGPRWHGEIGRFHEHDFVVWRGGRWIHGWHTGRFGWWWVIPGGWYFYPAPVYPYPDPYVPPVIAVQPAPPVAQAQPQTQAWYYCDRPSGYYPYVTECPSGWRTMPPTPPPAAAPRCTSASDAVSGVKYERETALHYFISDPHRVRHDPDRTDPSGDARPGKTLRSFCQR